MIRQNSSNIVIVVFFLLITEIIPQSNYLNNQKIYDFLDRMEVKGYISLNHHQKPFSRQTISDKLNDLAEKNLNDIEKKELSYFINEYNPDFAVSPESDLTVFAKNQNGAYRFLEYHDSLIYLNLLFDGGIEYSRGAEGNYKLRYWNGISTFGNLGENFSFDLKFNDFSDKGSSLRISRRFSREPGYEFATSRTSTSSYNYDKVDGNITYSWKWGNLSLIKDKNIWGNGYNGSIILSDKAPSFAHIRFKMYPTDWLEFTYIHGDLNSNIFDSTTYRNSGGNRGHIQMVPKYFAAHILTIDPTSDLKISLGESVVYSDRFEPIYLIPVLFFRIADHYLTNKDESSGNAQLFSSISYRFPSISTRLDASLFIDELSLSNLTGKYPEAVGYSIGFTNYDLFLANFGIRLEYTRINPFVYEHDDPVQSYFNRNYQMGHWVGSNAEQIYFQSSYPFNEYLRVKGEIEFTRRGEIFNKADERYKRGQNFLYGGRSQYLRYSLSAEYEMLNNLFVTISAVSSTAQGVNNIINVNDYNYNEVSAGVMLGYDY